MQPVFEKGASATDNSLIGAGRSLIVENNYGYTGPTSTQDGKTTTPGLERVDLDADGTGCRSVWRSQEIAPTVVPKLSAANGIVYTYTKDPQPDDQDAWYLTALDFRTGKTLYKRLGGEGLGHNNNYAPITLGPDGTAYVGVLGGLIGLRDATPPPGAAGAGRRGSGTRRHGSLRLKVRRLKGGRVRARVVGKGVRQVRRVTFRVRGKRVRVDRKRPFRATIARKRLQAPRPHEGRRPDRPQGRHAREAGQARPAPVAPRQLRWMGGAPTPRRTDLTLPILGLVLLAAVAHAAWNLLAKGAQGGRGSCGSTPSRRRCCTCRCSSWRWSSRPGRSAGRRSCSWPAAARCTRSTRRCSSAATATGDLSLVYPLARGTGPLVSTIAAIAIFGERPGRGGAARRAADRARGARAGPAGAGGRRRARPRGAGSRC